MNEDYSTLHAYSDGALSSEKRKEIDELLRQDPTLNEALSQVEEERAFIAHALATLEEPSLSTQNATLQLERFYQHLETATSTRVHEEKKDYHPTSSSSSSARWWSIFNSTPKWAIASALLLLLVIFILPRTSFSPFAPNFERSDSNLPPRWDLLLAKGQPFMKILYLKPSPTLQMKFSGNPATFKDVHYLRDGESLCPGALIQFHYQLAQKGFLMIVSLNAKGEIFSFVPFQGEKALISSKLKGYLPTSSSLELDDYLGPERFFLIWAPNPFLLKDVRRPLRKYWQKSGKDIRATPKILRKYFDDQGKNWRIFSILMEKKKKCH